MHTRKRPNKTPNGTPIHRCKNIRSTTISDPSGTPRHPRLAARPTPGLSRGPLKRKAIHGFRESYHQLVGRHICRLHAHHCFCDRVSYLLPDGSGAARLWQPGDVDEGHVISVLARATGRTPEIAEATKLPYVRTRLAVHSQRVPSARMATEQIRLATELNAAKFSWARRVGQDHTSVLRASTIKHLNSCR